MYALKCIRLGESFNETSSKVLREVDALSALRSDNVVRYYTAWVERGEIEHDDKNSFDELDGYSSSEHALDSPYVASEEVCGLCSEHYKDWIISYEQWGLIDAVLQPLNLCRQCYIKSLPPHIDASSIDIREKVILPECLYILMEYGGDTLSDVMKKIPKDDECTRWKLFAQCVQGLYSIHEQGFYHRDIKPGNIFVMDGAAKIGDLGLSTDARIASFSDTGSSAVGTLLYSAPEVEKGNYLKADIFSLGVVLVELFSDFQTGMERVKVLSKIRQGEMPEDFYPYSYQSLLARKMVDQNATNRPSAREILQELVNRELLDDPDSSVLLKIIQQLQNNVDRLECIVHERNDEVDKLRKLLADNGISEPD